MKARTHFLIAVFAGGGAALAVELAARFIAQRDLLASFLNGIDPPLVALGAFTLFTRLFAMLLVPAWIAYAGVRWGMEVWRARSAPIALPRSSA